MFACGMTQILYCPKNCTVLSHIPTLFLALQKSTSRTSTTQPYHTPPTRGERKGAGIPTNLSDLGSALLGVLPNAFNPIPLYLPHQTAPALRPLFKQNTLRKMYLELHSRVVREGQVHGGACPCQHIIGRGLVYIHLSLRVLHASTCKEGRQPDLQQHINRGSVNVRNAAIWRIVNHLPFTSAL